MVDKWHVYLARRAYTYYIKILIKIFHFDMWHIVPLYKKLYAVDIVRYLNNSVQRNTLVEIGCGLGDILRNVKYKSREGYDSSIDVLRAARFISRLSFKSGIVYKIFDFEVDDLNKSYDAIILVNWIHNVEPEVLKNKISRMCNTNLNPNGCIILDTVKNKNYKYNHDIKYLTNSLKCDIINNGTYEYGRTVWIIKNLF